MSKKAGRANAGKSGGRSAAFQLDQRSTRIGLAAILAFSAGLGLVSVFQYMKSPFFTMPVVDEAAYVNWARDLADGVSGRGVFYQAPLYPYFLTIIFKVSGDSLLAVRLIQACLGVACVYLVFWTGRRLMGDSAGLIAATVMALYRGLYFFDLLLLKAGLFVFISSASLALGVRAAERPNSKGRWIFLGMSLGLLSLLRGNFMLILPFLAGWAYLIERSGSRGAGILRAILMVAGISLVLLPVTIRNYSITKELVLTTSQGGANFYIGNSEFADGRYAKLPFVRANPLFESEDFEKEAERRSGRDLSPSQVSRFWFKEGLFWISAHPGAAARLMLHKARLMAHNQEVPDNHNFLIVRGLFVSALWAPFIGFGMLWGPALAGAWIMARREPRSWYPALFAILYPLSIIPFFIVARYRMAVVPAMALFSAAFIVWAAGKLRERDMRALSAAGAVVLASLLISFLPIREAREPLGLDYLTIGNVYCASGQPVECVEWYDKALADLPIEVTDVRARIMERRERALEIIAIMRRADGFIEGTELVGLGERLEALGQPKLAVEVYEKAAARRPDLLGPRSRLGDLLCNRREIRDIDKGLLHLNAALDLSPGHPDAMYAIGNCYFRDGNEKEARRWWETVLRLDPGYHPARENLEHLAKEGR
jgi:4-amino-4-deoxy-L-arabinose transferase-like glycosyltransferase